MDLRLDLSPLLLDLDLEVLSASPFSSPLNSTIENVYKESVAYLCIHCVQPGSAASTDATTAELFGSIYWPSMNILKLTPQIH